MLTGVIHGVLCSVHTAVCRLGIDSSSFDEVIIVREDLLDNVFGLEDQEAEAATAASRRVVFDGAVENVAKAGEVFSQIFLRRIPREST